MDRQDRVSRARHEALRFIARCDELIERHATDEYFRKYFEGGIGSKEMGAVKRASMDLTRALTELRK